MSDTVSRDVVRDFVTRHIEWLQGQLELFAGDPDSDIAGEIAIHNHLLAALDDAERYEETKKQLEFQRVITRTQQTLMEELVQSRAKSESFEHRLQQLAAARAGGEG